MSTNKKSNKGNNGELENYLKIPNHISNIPRSVLNRGAKQLLAHIYGFGYKGCWQSNETLGEMFMVSSCTIKRWISSIIKANLVYVKSPKGFYRTIWAKSHPDVERATKLWYRKREISKVEVQYGQVKSASLGQNDQVNKTQDVRSTGAKMTHLLGKNGTSTGAKMVLRLGQKCPTTNNNTIKETIQENATPTPLPAGGQASALLDDRNREAIHNMECLKKNFGIGKRGANWKPPSEEECERRRRQIKKQLGI